jgi:murein DD-endopeptidase MepM/ murein hydrolase activator NlpD
MNIRRFIQKVLALVVILLIVVSSSLYSFAATKSSLESEKTDVQEKIDETNSEIAGVKSKMTTQLNEITSLNSKISDYESEIETLEAQQSVLNKQISEKEEELAAKEAEYTENEELLEKRLVAMYKTGKTTYLEVLLSSKDISDFLSKYYLIAKLTEYDTSLLEKISEQKDEIAAAKEVLENQKAELASSIEQANTRKEALEVTTREKQKVVNNLSSEEKELQEQLDQYEADMKQIQKDLAAIAAAEAEAAKKNGVTTTTVTPSSCGYISPLVGKTKSNITTGWKGYSGHTGVDFAIAGGTNIVAVKDGTVEKSMALKNSDGTYRSYGEYVVINHHDGTMTLYAHGMPGSRTVEKGDTVKQGQVIMKVGTTGNSTGYHLHFSVLVNGTYVNPTNYLP